MQHLKRARILSATVFLTFGLSATALPSLAQSNSTCRQTIGADVKAISSDLSAIAAQANAQGFNAAVEQFAADMEVILPTLNRPSQEAVQKFVTDLEAATSASGPGGTTITGAERLKLTNDWVILVTSTGLTSAEINTISNDLTAALATLKGISTVQLQSDLNVLLGDLQACFDTAKAAAD